MSTSFPSVDLRPDHWAIVRRALRCHVPDREVLAFGSRATWTAKDYSDLDLAVMGEDPLSLRTVSALDEALGDSDLPFKVDVVDWARIDDGFRSIIRRGGVVVQAAEGAPTGIEPGQQSSSSQLSVHAEIVMGQSPPGNKSNNTGEGVPLLNGPTEFGSHHPEPTQYTIDVRKEACPGDLLFCVRGSTTGRMNWADQDYAIGRGIAAIRHKRGQQYQPFVRAVIEYSLPSLLKQATGSTFPNVSARQLAGMSWPPLELPEQRAIAHILGTLDDKIELNRQMNETLEAVARALFKSWFVDFDSVRAKMEGRDTGLPRDIADLFPDRLVDSEMGEVPEGWEVATLGDIAALRRKGVDPASEASDTPYIGLADMPRGSIALPNWGAAGSVSSRKSVFKAGDILFGKLRPYFHKVGIAPVDGLCSTDIVVLGARQPKWSALVLACVSSSAFVAHTSQTATRTKMPRTSWPAMRRYQLCRPTDNVASEFQRLDSPMLRRIVGNVHASRTLVALRDALLPQLISGKLRVQAAQEFIGSLG